MIPTTYAAWRHCIEVHCQIPLSADFVAKRLKELEDQQVYSTEQLRTDTAPVTSLSCSNGFNAQLKSYPMEIAEALTGGTEGAFAPPHAAQVHGAHPQWAQALRDGALIAEYPSRLPEPVLHCAERLAALPARSLFLHVGGDNLPARMRAVWMELGATDNEAGPLTAALAGPLVNGLAVLGAEGGKLRMEIVHARTCPKLHIDRLRWRLCCTLVGAGTEYLPSGRPADDDPDPPVMQMPSGILIGMAGLLSGTGLWHRSPHACATHPRVFVSLDIA